VWLTGDSSFTCILLQCGIEVSSPLCGVTGVVHKHPAKPKGSNVERYDRFVVMTQQIGALDAAKNFEKAFQKAFKSAFDPPAGHRANAGSRRGVKSN
jgi:hypothetical protein